jgi:thioredoxin-like negative regulator of GroEL
MPDAVEISADDFHDKVLESDEPVVVAFFSHSCPHCKKFRPIYKELTQILNRETRFFKIEVLNEQNRILAHGRGVRTVPTLEVFYRGRVIGNISGYHHLEKVYEAIKGFLMKKEENVGPGTPLEKLRMREPKFSIVGCQIRWSRKTTISKKTRQLIKKKLRGMSAILEKVMHCTREEALENRVAEIRLAVAPPVYLAVEYCRDGWHLGLETYDEAVGEIVRKGSPFVTELDDKDIETETV